MTAGQMEQELLCAWQALPMERQMQALDFVRFLREQPAPNAAPTDTTDEYEEPHLVNEDGFWVIAGGRPLSPEDAERDWVAEMREERIRSFFPENIRDADESAS